MTDSPPAPARAFGGYGSRSFEARRPFDAAEATRRPRGNRPCRSRRHRPVRVGVERDVGHGVAVAEQELPPAEALVEHREGGLRRLEPRGEDLRAFCVAPGQAPEARGADVRLEEVLLEEEPLPDARPLEKVAGPGVPSPR